LLPLSTKCAVWGCPLYLYSPAFHGYHHSEYKPAGAATTWVWPGGLAVYPAAAGETTWTGPYVCLLNGVPLWPLAAWATPQTTPPYTDDRAAPWAHLLRYCGATCISTCGVCGRGCAVLLHLSSTDILAMELPCLGFCPLDPPGGGLSPQIGRRGSAANVQLSLLLRHVMLFRTSKLGPWLPPHSPPEDLPWPCLCGNNLITRMQVWQLKDACRHVLKGLQRLLVPGIPMIRLPPGYGPALWGASTFDNKHPV